MYKSHEYPGPSQQDYANVEALNAQFIDLTLSLKRPQRGRLAAAPFLLFSMREDCTDWWSAVLAEPEQRDLLEETPVASPDTVRLQLAALGFVWQLAQRNPYAARLLTGAGFGWCEQITALPLVTLLRRAGDRGDLLVPRLETDSVVARRLLSDGVSSKPAIRRAAQLSVLQHLLTCSEADADAGMAAAACKMSGPSRTLRKV